MAACGGLEHIFEKPLPESPILLESLSPWKHIKSAKNVDRYSFTKIFGQLYLKENHVRDSPKSSTFSSPFPPSSLSSSFSSNSGFSEDSTPPLSAVDNPKSDENGSLGIHQEKRQHGRCDSISSMNSESLSICTEGVGFESSDEVDDLLKTENCNIDWQPQEQRLTNCTRTEYENYWCESRRSRRHIGAFPPPISCIGRNGKPWVSFESVRQDGRFILTEVRIPTQEFLHARRKNGCLKMQFVHSDDEILDEDEEEEDEENIEENNEVTGNNEYGYAQEI